MHRIRLEWEKKTPREGSRYFFYSPRVAKRFSIDEQTSPNALPLRRASAVGVPFESDGQVHNVSRAKTQSWISLDTAVQLAVIRPEPVRRATIVAVSNVLRPTRSDGPFSVTKSRFRVAKKLKRTQPLSVSCCNVVASGFPLSGLHRCRFYDRSTRSFGMRFSERNRERTNAFVYPEGEERSVTVKWTE